LPIANSQLQLQVSSLKSQISNLESRNLKLQLHNEKRMIRKKNTFIFCVFILPVVTKCFSADTDSAFVKISGYVDAYYAFYNDSVGTGKFQKFPSVCSRSNQFGLNTAQLTFQHDAEKVRALITLHYGDIPLSAWSGTFNAIMEAHAGIRLSRKLWLDAGFFRTHVGTEGLLPKENITSSVSVNTFYEPYFEGGVRLNYIPDDKLSVSLFALNGYGIYEDNNEQKSFGALVTYALGTKGSIGYSNYTGDDSPPGDSVSHTRIHQSVFWTYQVKKFKIQVGGDYCLQQNGDTTHTKVASMFSGVVCLRYSCRSNTSIYTRGEFFNDPQGFMSVLFTDKKGSLTGYKLFGITAGVEYKPTDNSYIRLESRELVMDKDQEIFYWKGDIKNNRLEILVNMGISF